jgi:hypothetical protein
MDRSAARIRAGSRAAAAKVARTVCRPKLHKLDHSKARALIGPALSRMSAYDERQKVLVRVLYCGPVTENL